MLLKKLEEKAVRYEEVNELVQDPDLIRDQKKYKDVMREHSHLTALMESYEEYKKVLQGIEDSKIIITEEHTIKCSYIDSNKKETTIQLHNNNTNQQKINIHLLIIQFPYFLFVITPHFLYDKL
mgnify:CR=1 FL=1